MTYTIKFERWDVVESDWVERNLSYPTAEEALRSLNYYMQGWQGVEGHCTIRGFRVERTVNA